MLSRRAIVGLVVLSLPVVGCASAKSKACHKQMAEAQDIVSAVDGNSLDSVDRSVAAIASAEAVCKANGLSSELSELAAARERLLGHRELLVEREERKRGANLTPEQLTEYLKSGDPNCPKGQAYSHKASGKQIRCAGPWPAEMTRAQATKYYKGRGFRHISGAPEDRLAMEYGAERYVFFYRGAGEQAPYCLVLYPKPDIAWQEAVAKITGTSPEKLKAGGKVVVLGQSLGIFVDEKNSIAKVGDCPEKVL
jgi:hypothetical protein